MLPQTSIKVEDLEELIEGFATTFKESHQIKASLSLAPEFHEFAIDDAFGNLVYRTNFEISMTNPIHEEFLSAKIYGVIKGNIGLQMDKKRPDLLLV